MKRLFKGVWIEQKEGEYPQQAYERACKEMREAREKPELLPRWLVEGGRKKGTRVVGGPDDVTFVRQSFVKGMDD